LKKYKWPGRDEVSVELIQAAGETLLSEFHRPIHSVSNKEDLLDQWKESVVPKYKKGDKSECWNYHGISLLSTSYKVLSNILLSRLSPYIDKITGVIGVGFDITDQLPIRFSAFARYWSKNLSTVRQYLATDPEARVRFPALPKKKSSVSGTGSTQPREYK
jgi:hypothetical protein